MLFYTGSVSSEVLAQFFTAFPKDLPVIGTQIYSLYGSTEIAALTADNPGWQVRVYRYGKTGQFTKRWISEVFPLEFAVSSSEKFRMVSADPLHDSTDIEFSGCKAHDCGNSYGVLLYSPSRSQWFQAVQTNGKTTISKDSDNPANEALRQYLAKRLATCIPHAPHEEAVRPLLARQEHSRRDSSSGEVAFSVQTPKLQLQELQATREGVMDDASLKDFRSELRYGRSTRRCASRLTSQRVSTGQ